MTDGPALAGLSIADPPERWAAIGSSDLGNGGRLCVGSVRVTLGIAPQGAGIVGWTLDGLGSDGDIEGLRTAQGSCVSGVVSEPRPAVPPGRRIATVTGEAGLSTRVAFSDAARG